MNETSADVPGGRDMWVRRRWCFWLAMALVVLGAVSNAIYLWNHCPLDLSEDESHYWEWSRQLDYGYYSKPPGIAWVIWAAVRLGGSVMPVVRMPAVVFGLMSGVLSLLLARRVFRDDRAALAVILLSAAVPMFAVGSLLITIDSPMYLCWAASVYCLWRAVEEGNATDGARNTKPRAGWLYLAGLACAMGMLFKPVLIAVPICAAAAAWGDLAIRRALKTWHSLGAGLVVLLSFVPIVVWNSQHGWVTFKHIATQGGFAGEAEKSSKAALALQHLGSFLGGQAGGMGGVMFVMLVVGVMAAVRRVRTISTPNESPAPLGMAHDGPANERIGWVFLLSFALPLWAFYFVMNFWKGTEANWPAASYFAAMVLLAGVLVRGWNAADAKVRRTWRAWGTVTVAWGFALSMAAMNLQRFYPLVVPKLAPLEGTPQYSKSLWNPTKWDLAAKKLRGFQERAAVVQGALDELRKETGQEPVVVTTRYDTSSSLAFYLPGQPFVYCIMSSVGQGRQSQYDLWPGINERDANGNLVLAGRPMLIVGMPDRTTIDRLLQPAFDRVGPPVHVPARYQGVILHDVVMIKAYGFKGMPLVKNDQY